MDAEAKNARLASRAASEKHAEFLLTSADDECLKGLNSVLLSKDEVDALFGPGNWVTVPRFVVEQASGQMRGCDDGAIGEQNDATEVPEKLVLPSASFPGQIGRAMHVEADRRGLKLHAQGISLESGGEDWPDAYRFKPTRPDEQPYFIVVFRTSSGEVKYLVMYGCLFGLLGSVFAFNRHPRLFEAICRRCAGLPAAMYFDDLNVSDLSTAKGAGQQLAGDLSAALGSPFADKKRQPMADQSAFLGVEHDLKAVFED